MEMKFEKVRYVLVLRQKQTRRGKNDLYSQKMVKISQVFHTNVLRKCGDKGEKKRHRIASQNDIVNIEKKIRI